MITASSSLAAGLLGGYFGTGASSGGSGNLGTNIAAGAQSTDAYILQGSLGSASTLASFLSNAAFAQDTEALLLDPRANGELTGTPSANVQKIISEIGTAMGAPASAASGSTASSSRAPTTDASSTSTGTAGGLPPEGVIA